MQGTLDCADFVSFFLGYLCSLSLPELSLADSHVGGYYRKITPEVLEKIIRSGVSD